MYIVWNPITTQEKHEVKLFTDDANNPSDIMLSGVELIFSESPGGHDWQKIDLDVPVVLVVGKIYWIVVESYHAYFSLTTCSEGGVEVPVRATVNDIWSKGDDEQKRVMARFYGRVFPAISSSAPLSI